VRRVALLVGNSEFARDSGLSTLRFPPADVDALAALLDDTKIGRFDRVEKLVNRTSGDIVNAIDNLLHQERGAFVVFYYSGHGIVSDGGRLYLAATNTKNGRPASGVLFAQLMQLKDDYGYSRFSVVLDCCFAGLARDDLKASPDDQLKAFAEGKGVFFLGAANSTQAAREDPALGHGVLTAAILAGLKSGDADLDGDGRISGSDLYNWCTRTMSGASHKPTLVNRGDDGELVFAFARERLTPEILAQVRRKITLCWEHRLLAIAQIDQLRELFSESHIGTRPAPGTLGDNFLAFAEGRVDFDAFLGSSQGTSTQDNNRRVGKKRKDGLLIGGVVLVFISLAVTDFASKSYSWPLTIIGDIGFIVGITYVLFRIIVAWFRN
jgi:hypothetical protein